jgi:hypothetical protein
MAKSSFGREPKMATTEPSADEVGGGMKRGGHAKHKKHMAMGGNPLMAPPMGRMARPAIRPVMARPALLRKHGGKAEGGAEHKAEMKEMHKIEKELKHHEGMKAAKAHHGLKKGGKAPKAGPDIMGGLEGGIEATRPVASKKTGTIEGPGYKKGGHTKKHHMAKGGQALAAKGDAFETKTTLKPKIDVNDKVSEAKQTKSFNTKTGGVEGKGYKHGGHTKKHHYAGGGTVKDSVAKRYLNDMHDGEKMPTKKAGTGEIKQVPAGYKHGGHIKHHEHHSKHAAGGHVHMHKHAAKHSHGHEHHSKHETHHKAGGHHTTKMSTHKKAGGACNY